MTLASAVEPCRSAKFLANVVGLHLSAGVRLRSRTRGTVTPPDQRHPTISTDYTLERPAHWHHANLDAIREQSPFTFNDSTYGFWMINRCDHVREALQTPEVFTCEATGVLAEPGQKPRLLPQNLDGAEHMAYRHILNPWFGPRAIERTAPLARRRAADLIDELQPKGRCDLATDFAMQYPTEIFLAHLGLPIEDGERLVPLVEAMFQGFFGGDTGEMAQTVAELKAYFRRQFKDRDNNPRDPATDFITHLMTADMDGRPFPEDDRVTLAFTIMLAGLDTTRSTLGYIFHHLATYPDDRKWLLEDLTRLPMAIEEFLRLYSLLIQIGRTVATDTDFHGCPLQKGDMVWLGAATANRDPREFDRPTDFDRNRTSNRHLAFGAGPHRCLGAHLARKELLIVLEEWLKRIPDFRLTPRVEIAERGGQLMLTSLPLEWDR